LDEADFYLDEAEKRIEASKLLLDRGYYKDAISRAYYSMYYASKALLSMKEEWNGGEEKEEETFSLKM